ncbi:MAG: hypothetical protein HOQ24_17460 [Mycobacteriaceae bacterium]|nr:hypothetical protein [Mycobacteriaceae bacterium]
MARINVVMNDGLAEQLRAASQGKLSEYIVRAVRRQLVEDDLRLLRDLPDDPDLAALSEEAAESSGVA